jgi:UDP-N-acetylglucosamine acyltransferase
VKIHPTAVIGAEVELAPDVEIGPHACVEGRTRVGPGCIIQANAVLTGNVWLGRNNMIGYGAIIGADPQDTAFQPDADSQVWIGDYNVIREYCTIHRGTAKSSTTHVGDKNFLMAGVHLGHNAQIGNNVVIANNCLLGGHVEVHDGAFIGGACVFHQHMRVGTLALTQGQSAFSKDIPPYTLAAERNSVAGLNVVGLRRAGISVEQRKEIKDAFKLFYRSGLNTTQALERAERHKWGKAGRTFFEFIEGAKRRGVCDLLREDGSTEENPAD